MRALIRRCERLAEHTAYFNTQPTLASLALCGAATFVCNPLSAPRGAFGDAVEPPLYGLLQEFMVLGTR